MFRCTVSREEKRTDEEILEMAVRGSKQQNRKHESNRDVDQRNNIGNGENNSLLEKNKKSETIAQFREQVAALGRQKETKK
jgi:hypothetical protein